MSTTTDKLRSRLSVDAGELVREEAIQARFRAGLRGEAISQGDATRWARFEAADYLRALATSLTED